MLKQLIVKLDAKLLGYVQRWPSWLYAPMFTVTTIGHPVSQGVVIFISAYIAWQSGHSAGVLALGAAFIAMVANTILKHFIHRPRPDTLYVSRMWFATSSFPSGHTFSATVTCGILAALAAQYVGAQLQPAVFALLGLFVASVGVSRVFLGAHYPSDVIAGWLLGGGAIVLILWMIKL